MGAADDAEHRAWRELYDLRMQVEDMAAREDITGCPVPWCDEQGKHWWPHELDGSRGSRLHEHEVWSTDQLGQGAAVAVEMFERDGLDEGDQEANVYVAVNVYADDLRFANSEDLGRFIAGLLHAASIAFPDAAFN